MKPMTSLRELYIQELQDLHSAERQALAHLPGMIEAARDPDVRATLELQRERIEKQLARLERLFRRSEAEPGDGICRAMAGLIAEANRAVRERASDDVRDAAIVAEAQRIEHFGIAGYGVARAFAEQLGDFESADILQETLTEASLTDQTLSRLAEGRVDFETRAALETHRPRRQRYSRLVDG